MEKGTYSDWTADFYCFFMLGIGLTIYGVSWRCFMGRDTMTFCCPFLPVKVIKFYEITRVTYTENRTTGYGQNASPLPLSIPLL